jgi:peptide/nickel transport system substrate-binding protein
LDTIPRGNIATHPLMTQHPIGAGPYRMERWGDDGTIELVADTNFFLGRPGIRRIVFRTVSDFGAKLTALASGDGDFVEFLGGLPAIERIEQSTQARVVSYASPVYNYLGFNFRSPADTTQPHPLFSDVRVRRALSLLVDRAAVNDAVTGGHGMVAQSPMTPMIRLTSVAIPAYEQDTARALQLLRDAGWTDSNGDGVLDRNGRTFSFEMLYPSTSGVRQTTAISLEEMFRNAGLDVDVNAVDFSTYVEQQQSGSFDTFINSQFTTPSPSSVKTAWIAGATFNWGRYHNPRFEAAVKRFENATSPNDRQQALEDAFTTMHEDAAAIWLYYLNMNAGVHTRFENVSLRPDSWSVTVWQWRVRNGAWEPRDLVGN